MDFAGNWREEGGAKDRRKDTPQLTIEAVTPEDQICDLFTKPLAENYSL